VENDGMRREHLIMPPEQKMALVGIFLVAIPLSIGGMLGVVTPTVFADCNDVFRHCFGMQPAAASSTMLIRAVSALALVEAVALIGLLI